MPTDDERREVAARLRELPIDMYEVEERWEAEGLCADRHDQTDYSLIHNVLLGCLPAEHMHQCDYEELHCRLADLIEPGERTCRDDGIGVFRCTRCGAFAKRGAVMDCTGQIPLRYCPNCGARVEVGE